MAMRRYEIYLRVLKIFHSFAALTREIFLQHEKRNFVSPSGHVMFYLPMKYQTIPFYGVKGAIYYVAIAKVILIFRCEDNMLFSHVKISRFRSKAHLVFHWCLYNK